ncbi:transmembrane protein, putative (macronuclear) [Tetrahymena thermophila SB210]|uniref:Transmembrane protein, putative n=1 Tax=Tetrahymena thermophila (strain SB210) TaxID=312017 RepID=W7X756_TETTS|nr:transmembrane protein, putative [Tetrahymena thermophila SB210]EWS73192.1 transmembrane protein, putative [Tetrahymena thermophila SB210]|eukprot:XP_012654268.1 transmembrane protein, putative [Tetrahymena thermophila SB210]
MNTISLKNLLIMDISAKQQSITYSLLGQLCYQQLQAQSFYFQVAYLQVNSKQRMSIIPTNQYIKMKLITKQSKQNSFMSEKNILQLLYQNYLFFYVYIQLTDMYLNIYKLIYLYYQKINQNLLHKLYLFQ